MENQESPIATESVKKSESGIAAILGLVLIIALIALGAYATFKERETRRAVPEEVPTEPTPNLLEASSSAGVPYPS